MISTNFLQIFLLLILLQLCRSISNKPHIIIIMADDMGFNDVGIHGSDQIPTPNIDALHVYGISLNRFYTAPMCSPSRSSLMTGKYPSNIGMQHYVITSDEPFGLGLNEKILPEYLKKAGYSTHIIGKWHLGFFQQKYSPCMRGFDSHFGYMGPYIDYFNHSLSRMGLPIPFESGYDMRKNFSINYETKGIYATDLFSDVAVKTIQNHNADVPLFMYLSHLAPHSANRFDLNQAPPEVIQRFSYIKDEMRRKYAAMVSILDDGVGKVVAALHEQKMLENSVILFLSDNGAAVTGENLNVGSNFPFRGQKDSPWEGAVRVTAAIWSNYLEKQQRVSNQLVHISDLLPTFSHLAGINVMDPSIDGKNVWDALSLNLDSPRNEILLNYDADIPYSSYIRGQWKVINGTTYNGIYDNWLSEQDILEKHGSFSAYGESIMDSATGKILSSFPSRSGMQPLTAAAIEDLREQNQVYCKDIQYPNEDDEWHCNPLAGPCLFKIFDDPCEQRNLAKEYSVMLRILNDDFEKLRETAVPPRNRPSDTRSNPKFFNNTWTWWYDELGLNDDGSGASGMFKLNSVSVILIFCLIHLFIV